MEQLIERYAGLDVHRDTVVATVRSPKPSRAGRKIETRTFATTTPGLNALADWLVVERVDRVGMESTGVYWKPVFFTLEGRVPQVWLLNAERLRNVPGRKTDVADSAWIAQLVEHGLVAPSFVPPAALRELRDWTRHRRVLVEERTRVIQRLDKTLQDAGIKLTSVASSLLTKSGRVILEALLTGVVDPQTLAELAKGRLRSKIPALREALAGEFRVALPTMTCSSPTGTLLTTASTTKSSARTRPCGAIRASTRLDDSCAHSKPSVCTYNSATPPDSA